jgi:SAM-dependent methyltransferase
VGVAEAGVITAAEAAQAARSLAPFLPSSLVSAFDSSFIRSGELYDEFIVRLALHILRQTGLANAAREPGTTTEMVTRAGFDPGRAAVPVDWILRRLAARGILEQLEVPGAPRRFHARDPLPALDPSVIRDEQLREDRSWLPAYVLAETVAQDYPAFLRGERTGEALLFSPARLRLWLEFFSNDNGLYAVNNRVGAVAAGEWLPPGRATILEVGGGLGSGALALLDHLQATGRDKDIVDYRFTDVVPVFLRRGQQAVETRFPGVAATFTTLDMNRPLREQGVQPATCSLVYAVNTIHVARDLAFTLRELRDALVPGGTLAMSECVRLVPGQALYPEFIFNLLESFRSPVLHETYRPNGGFLTLDQWRDALLAAGFVDIRVIPDLAALRNAFPKLCTAAAAIGATR